MLNILWKFIAGLLLFFVLVEGVNVGLWLINAPSDVAIMAGVAVMALSLSLPIWFFMKLLKFSRKQDA